MAVAVGTRVISRPPHRSVRAAFPHTACMGLSLSRVHHATFVVLCCFILCSTRAASILPSRPHITVAVAHRRQAARDRAVYHAVIRGEPASSPVVARRHSAISSLRASATIIVVLRAPLGPSVRVRYHRASALSFWNIRKRHANWISPRRTRALPALARPFSRLFKPLSSGDPVSPA